MATTSFHLMLCVAVRTLLPKNDVRRQEFLGWMISAAIMAGPFALKHLAQCWHSYVSTFEAVTMLAPTVLNCLNYLQNSGAVSNGNAAHTSGRTAGKSSGITLDGMSTNSLRVYSFHSFPTSHLEYVRKAVRTMIVEVSSNAQNILIFYSLN